MFQKRAQHKSGSGVVTAKECGDGFLVTVNKEQLPPHYSQTHATEDDALADFDRLAVATMTIPEASQWYSIPRPTLYRAASEGRLDARKSGGTWLIAREAMERYAAEYEPRQ
jgi:excisionase family DNA binding protein